MCPWERACQPPWCRGWIRGLWLGLLGRGGGLLGRCRLGEGGIRGLRGLLGGWRRGFWCGFRCAGGLGFQGGGLGGSRPMSRRRQLFRAGMN